MTSLTAHAALSGELTLNTLVQTVGLVVAGLATVVAFPRVATTFWLLRAVTSKVALSTATGVNIGQRWSYRYCAMGRDSRATPSIRWCTVEVAVGVLTGILG